MNKKEFVKAIRLAVRENTAQDTLSYLESPPRRKSITTEEQAITAWSKGLPEEGRQYLLHIMEKAIDASIFGMLCVLDGARAVESTLEKGAFSLYYEKNGNRVLLNSSDDEFLHDIYRSDMH